MKLIEFVKLLHRAYKYKYKNDKGGIAYIIAAVEKGQTVLDIGAHKAGYLYFMLKQVGPAGRVFAFEPQSKLFQYIKHMKGLFRWENVSIEHLALSDAAGLATLYIPANKKSKTSSPGATIAVLKESSGIAATEKVITETLDAYCTRNNIQPSFLKVDVEGNELRIFQGGIDTLKKFRPKILVEIEERHVGKEKVLETFMFMESLGYKGQVIHGMDRVPLANFSFEKYQNRHDMKNYCNNFIFA